MIPLLDVLKKSFGFDSFRPLQEEIINDSLRGRDVFALLPTGGGKSLCFQLPALLRPGLTLVVSPLIALMKDQVDALETAGVPATFLNSSLEAGESAKRRRALEAGECKLLYVAPERLSSDGVIADLKRWDVNLIAVDEAHCISEWGHDFRPEYRRLAELREHFPTVPVMALTATATGRVREDILRQLKLRDPACYVASFNRPNLTYRVIPKQKAYAQVLSFVRLRSSESGIVYCQSRKSTESLAERLRADGIEARPYHAGLAAEQRSRNQERFIRDEAQVICATVAFGMGINKPNVRYVIHYDLPKNVEGYYQETGRAGRDGLPSECLLLYSAGDVVKYSQFIDDKNDPQERAFAHDQLRRIVHYAESAQCRRVDLLEYFGEKFDTADGNCAACDNCLTPRATFDGTVAAQKFLSAVYRIRERSGFGVGLNHVVEVLTGADTEKIRRWNHESLSVYGIGKEHSRQQWSLIGRELVRLGLLRQTSGKFSVLELSAEGRNVLAGNRNVMLTQIAAVEPLKSRSRRGDDVETAADGEGTKRRAGEIVCDERLFERLRRLRKSLADERNVPAYIVFSDTALRHMASVLPRNEQEFLGINGVGDKKLKEFGTIFLAEIARDSVEKSLLNPAN